MTIRIRFAPSPTGFMHVGHLRAALPNVLLALATREGGEKANLILRFEDSDFDRNQLASEPAFMEDLAWLGFDFDEGVHVDNAKPFGPYRTLERSERGDYAKAVEKLMAMGRAYECFTSPEELDLLRKVQQSKNEPPRYDNRHRNLTDEQKAAFRAEGRKPVVRFKLTDNEIVFNDLIKGELRFKPENLGGDPVIVRASGLPLFTFYGCVDDIAMNITHVIRGEDHLTNAAVQVQMYEAFGATPPKFAHIPLMLDKDGHKMSKRLGALQIRQLKEQGFLPNAILSYMASLGLAEAPRPGAPIAELSKGFGFDKCGKSPVRFDEEQLAHTNKTTLHHAEWVDVEPYIAAFIPAGVSADSVQALWPQLRESLSTLADLPAALAPITSRPEGLNLPDADAAFIKSSLDVLPEEWNADIWNNWLNKVKEATGRKGKDLFMPLRLALTGQAHGPELAPLMQHWGRAEVVARLSAAARCN